MSVCCLKYGSIFSQCIMGSTFDSSNHRKNETCQLLVSEGNQQFTKSFSCRSFFLVWTSGSIECFQLSKQRHGDPMCEFKGVEVDGKHTQRILILDNWLGNDREQTERLQIYFHFHDDSRLLTCLIPSRRQSTWCHFGTINYVRSICLDEVECWLEGW